MVHPLLMRQTRTHGNSGGSSRSSGRGSRSGRGSGGGGGTAPTVRQQAALGLLPAERLIWDGHAGGAGGLGVLGGVGGVEGAAMGMAEQTLMDAIEVC